MRTFQLSTTLAAPASTVRDHLQRPELLRYVTRGFLAFVPLEPPAFPERWAPGRYQVLLKFGGWLPLGRHTIGIENPVLEGDRWRLRDNGGGALARVWDHVIEVIPDGRGTRYTDTLTVDAGILEAPVFLFARAFYSYRQYRWRRLVASGFDYAR